MITKEQCRRILEKTIAASRAKDVIVSLSGGKENLSRFANNYIHQNVVKKDYVLTITAIHGKKIGRASTNDFNHHAIELACRQAESIAEVMPENNLFQGLVNPATYQEVHQAYIPETVEANPHLKANTIEKITAPAQRSKITAAGAFSTGDSVTALMNSKGLFAYHTHTTCDFTLSIMTPNRGSGWAEYHCSDVREVNPDLLLDVAREKALRSENPLPLDPGHYTVILEPVATSTFLMFLGYLGFGGQGYLEDRSCFSGKLGQMVTGANIHIVDDFKNPETLGIPFDVDGSPRTTLPLIENGIIRNIAFSHAESQKSGVPNTGHGLGLIHGGYPRNLSLKAGTVPQKEIIADTKKGILVTRTFYDNVVEPKIPKITGMTRDGTFLIEDGKVTRPLKNLRYNEDILDVLKRVDLLSCETRRLDAFGNMSVPMARIRDFHITGCTA